MEYAMSSKHGWKCVVCTTMLMKITASRPINNDIIHGGKCSNVWN